MRIYSDKSKQLDNYQYYLSTTEPLRFNIFPSVCVSCESAWTSTPVKHLLNTIQCIITAYEWMCVSNLSIAGLDGLDENGLLGVNLWWALMLGLRTGLCDRERQHVHTALTLLSQAARITPLKRVINPNSYTKSLRLMNHGCALYIISNYMSLLLITQRGQVAAEINTIFQLLIHQTAEAKLWVYWLVALWWLPLWIKEP